MNLSFLKKRPANTLSNWSLVFFHDECPNAEEILLEFLHCVNNRVYVPSGKFRLHGIVNHHPKFEDGSVIMTSAVSSMEVISKKNTKSCLLKVITASGSEYHIYTDEASIGQIEASIKNLPIIIRNSASI